MTSSKISQLAALMRSSELMDTQKGSRQENDPVFGALLNQTSGGGKQNAFTWNQAGIQPPKGEMANQTAFAKESSKAGFKGNAINQNGGPDIQDKLPEDAGEKLNTFEEKATEAVAEELGVTEEEVTEAMEAMGLTVLDLMDPAKLADLVMELTGSEDIGSLLLSEGFQQMLGEIGELSQELMAELGLTPEELPQFMEQLQSIMQEQPEEEPADIPVQEAVQPETGTETTDQVPEEPVQDAEVPQPSTAETAVTAEQKATNESIQENTKDVKEADSAGIENAAEEPESRNVTSDDWQQENSQENAKEGSQEKSFTEMAGKKGADKTDNAPQHHVTYQTTAQTVNQGQAVEITQTVVQTRIDVEDIMRQVSHMTRVMVSQAESSIEMQLNPANLGKVYLQVVSREGVITAQLAAQNEAVKEALENQVAILKENMNQQGIKVEAIEVTIASHEFERNLEQNQQGTAGEQQEAEARKASRRNINLNNSEELEGMMSEEENLVAKIMLEQGNSVDLSA